MEAHRLAVCALMELVMPNCFATGKVQDCLHSYKRETGLRPITEDGGTMAGAFDECFHGRGIGQFGRGTRIVRMMLRAGGPCHYPNMKRIIPLLGLVPSPCSPVVRYEWQRESVDGRESYDILFVLP